VVYRNFWRWDDPKHQNMKYWPNMDTVPELAGISHQMIFLEVTEEASRLFDWAHELCRCVVSVGQIGSSSSVAPTTIVGRCNVVRVVLVL
jgi:hypothetical protein